MSQYPEPAPYGASGAYGGGAPPRRRTRPSAWWFAAGAALLAVGLTLAGSALVLSIAAFARVDAQIPADGVTRTVAVERDTVYLVWERPTETARCQFVDAATRNEAPQESLGFTSYNRELGSGAWEGALTFTAPSAQVEVTCAPGGSAIEIGEKPRVHTLVGGIFVGLVVPILLAVAGAIVLIVVGVLFATGAKRPKRP